MATGAFAMFYWNGRLLVATGSGVAVMLLVYLLHDWQPKWNGAQTRKFLQGWNQPFLIAAGAGAIATFVIYLAVSVWAESDSGWIATGAILQGLGTLTVLVWLVWQRLNHLRDRSLINHHQLLLDLTHENSLKRLIAVRQLTDVVSVLDDQPYLLRPQVGSQMQTQRRGTPKKPSRRDMASYFHLMLAQESEPIVRDAILDGLQTLEIVQQLQQVRRYF
jgi:hypothetical protein